MNFYEKPLCDLTDEEWEQICLKCGKCCMCKYQENDIVHFSNYMCRFFDVKRGICSCYANRLSIAKGECVKVDINLLEQHLEFLPPSCAYRHLYEGRGLPAYHPLLTGDSNSAVAAGCTVKSLPVISETTKTKALDNLLQKITKHHWQASQVVEKLKKINKACSLRWLESYPLPVK